MGALASNHNYIIEVKDDPSKNIWTFLASIHLEIWECKDLDPVIHANMDL